MIAREGAVILCNLERAEHLPQAAVQCAECIETLPVLIDCRRKLRGVVRKHNTWRNALRRWMNAVRGD
jgi:L-lactate utilization protein LutB